MDNLFFSLQIVAPLFIMMVIGYIVKLTGIVNEETVKRVNKLIFKVFLPLLVFYNIYQSDFERSFSSNLVIFVIVCIVIQFFIALSIVLLTEKDNPKRGAMLQGMFRSNYVLFGIPISNAIFGGDAAGVASILIAIVIPVFNILAVIALEMFNGGKPNFFKTLFGIIKNPLIIASILAILLKVFHCTLPVVIINTVGDLSGIATPLSFIMLGAYFSFGDVGHYIKQITLTTLFKLIVFPLIFIGAAILMGFRDIPLAVILSVFASPIAVSSFTMAQEMGGDGKLAGQLVVFTSVLSVLTIFLFIFLLKEFAYI